MGELPYHPDSRGANGDDHFVLALGIEGDEVVVHDPAGYPAVPLGLEALERAWRADLVPYRRGSVPSVALARSHREPPPGGDR